MTGFFAAFAACGRFAAALCAFGAAVFFAATRTVAAGFLEAAGFAAGDLEDAAFVPVPFLVPGDVFFATVLVDLAAALAVDVAGVLRAGLAVAFVLAALAEERALAWDAGFFADAFAPAFAFEASAAALGAGAFTICAFGAAVFLAAVLAVVAFAVVALAEEDFAAGALLAPDVFALVDLAERAARAAAAALAATFVLSDAFFGAFVRGAAFPRLVIRTASRAPPPASISSPLCSIFARFPFE